SPVEQDKGGKRAACEPVALALDENAVEARVRLVGGVERHGAHHHPRLGRIVTSDGSDQRSEAFWRRRSPPNVCSPAFRGVYKRRRKGHQLGHLVHHNLSGGCGYDCGYTRARVDTSICFLQQCSSPKALGCTTPDVGSTCKLR